MFTGLTACRVCGSPIKSILRFGDMPLANRYPATESETDFRAPLDVVLCVTCGCVQLAHTVDPKVLFEDYLYTSSTSGSLAEHFKKYATDTVGKLQLNPKEDFIVGIGGNDGPLEAAYQKMEFEVLNVEPAVNIANRSRANGVPTWNEWFNEEVASAIVDEHGHASLVTCNNCFAHMPDIHGVVKAIKTLLQPNGWFVSEEGYWLDAVRGNHFDRIYHEHVFYWTVRALANLFRQHDLGIGHIEFNASQGGSVRVFVSKDTKTDCSAVGYAITKEDAYGLFDPETYANWSRAIDDWEKICSAFLAPLEAVCCYGVPAKFTMISEQLSFTREKIQYAVEDSPIKVGRFTPGSHIPIVGRDHFIEHPTGHCIITATNYADWIIKANPQFKDKWIVLTPEPKVLLT